MSSRDGGLDQEQLHNAALIYQVGRQIGMSARDIQIALITAMTESGLRNVHYGDRDSQGLFQQRPSQGWGSVAQVTDPVYATKKFFSALRGLGDRRYHMSMGEAAQAVQRSAYPDRYAKNLPLIRGMFPTLAGMTGGKPKDMGGNDYGSPMPQVHPVTGQVDMVPNPDQPINPMSVLAADYNPVLAAPTFGGVGYDPNPSMQPDQPWQSPISPATNQVIKDQAAAASAANAGFKYQKGLDGWRQAIVQTAHQFIGDPYVWGGNSPGRFDCSGLVQYVYGKVGIQMPRISFQQANSGQRVGLNQLRPGDLVAWDNSARNNGADHIAIYIGNGQIIEAPKPGLSVRVRKLGHNEGAWGVRINRK